MEGTIYLYFEGFEIGIALQELNLQENTKDNEVKQAAIKHLDKLGVPFRTFPGYIEGLPFDVMEG